MRSPTPWSRPRIGVVGAPGLVVADDRGLPLARGGVLCDNQSVDTPEPAIVSAIAATIAAVLAGATLYVNGRREQRSWRREAMIDSLVTFMDSSFDGAGQRVRRLRTDGRDINTYLETTKELEAKQLAVLTRLRLIAPSGVVVAAERLREADYQVHRALLQAQTMPTEESWKLLRDEQRAARSDLLEQARRTLDLDRGPNITRLRTLH